MKVLKFLSMHRAQFIGALVLLAVLIALLILFARPGGDIGTGQPSFDTADETTGDITTVFDPGALSKSGKSYFNILTNYSAAEQPETSDFTADENSTTVLSKFVYERNRGTEEKFGVIVREITSSTPEELINGTIASGGDVYQMVALPISGGISALISSNSLADLSGISTLTRSGGWYDPNCERDLSLGGKIFVMTGEIISNYNDAVWTTVYNKRLTEMAGIKTGEFEGLVYDNKWTLDYMHTLMKNSVEILDGYDTEFVYGLCGSNDTTFSLCLGAGASVVQKDYFDMPIITSMSEDFYNVFRKVLELQTDRTLVSHTLIEFSNKTALFKYAKLGEARAYIADGMDVGILPLPLYSPDQTSYRSPLELSVTIGFAVPKSNTKLEFTGAIIDYMSEYSYKNIAPLYKNSFKLNSEGSGKVYNLILNTRFYDLVDMFGWGGIKKALADITVSGGQDEFESVMTLRATLAEKAMSIIIKRIMDTVPS